MAPMTVLEQMMKNSKAEDREKGMAAWQAWNDAHEENVVEMGMPWGRRRPSNRTASLTRRTKSVAIRLCRRIRSLRQRRYSRISPHLTVMQGSSIDVLECMNMDEM